MTAYRFEKKNKYLLLKQEDIEAFLSPLQKVALDDICDTIGYQRKQLHKEVNKYVVVNENESYAREVWRLIKDEEDNKYIQKSIDNNTWYRASGDCICSECSKMYKEHNSGSYLFPTFHIICNGDVVKT